MMRKAAQPTKKRKQARQEVDEARFNAEMAYGDSVFRYALGDAEASIEAAYRALEFLPTYAPAMLTVGADEAGQLEEAERELLRAVAMDAADERAAANLEYCREKIEAAKVAEKPTRRSRRTPS